MPRVKQTASELFERRPQNVRRAIAPLRGARPFQCDFLKNWVGNSKVLGVAEQLTPGDPHRELWFRSFVFRIDCQYLEFWVPYRNGEQYYLEQSVFTCRIIGDGGVRPFDLVSIHIEPECRGEEPVHSFKRSMHLHVADSRSPMPHCHFPLDLWRLPIRSGSIGEYTKMLENAVRVVRCEVLKRYAVERFNVPVEALAEFTSW